MCVFFSVLGLIQIPAALVTARAYRAEDLHN